MTKGTASLWIGGLGAVLAATSAPAQTSNGAAPIGPPQLENFQLQPQRPQPQRPETQGPPAPPRTSTQAPGATTGAPAGGPPIVAVPPAPVMPSLRLPPATDSARRPAPRPVPAEVRRAPPANATTTAPPAAAPALPQATPLPPANESAPAETAPPPAPAAESEPPPISIPGEQRTPSTGGTLPLWLEGAGAVLVVLLGLLWWRRRRAHLRVRAEALEEVRIAAAAPPPPPAPRPAASRSDPADRPWLEIALRAERATFNQAETLVQFELDIINAGASAARDVRIDVKLFNAGAEQDQEIGAFFHTAGRETARVNLPGIEPKVNGTIRGEVGMARDAMRAVRLDERLLYIPVIAVNVLYDYGEGQTGQTSKSYVVGRELQQPGEKMGAFRVDQGPRVWRTVGQRQHKLARRI
jgi:LPXTG-motif cell wall-anchored protein